MNKQIILAQGAEAIIIKTDKIIKKIRVEKSYRHPLLDQKLRKLRTRSESKIMQKLAGVISVPNIKKVDEQKKEIDMEYIEGKKLSQTLEKLEYKKISKKIAIIITQLHAQNIIHGDLTTANMLYKKNNDTLYLIDFGLAFHSAKIEDKAVDLHLLKHALEAKHPTIADTCMKIILQNIIILIKIL